VILQYTEIEKYDLYAADNHGFENVDNLQSGTLLVPFNNFLETEILEIPK